MSVIKAHQSEIFPNLAFGIAVGIRAACRQTIDQDFGTIRHRPEVVGVGQHSWLEIRNRRIYAGSIWKQTLTGLGVWHNRDTGDAPPLPKSFVVSKKECLVFFQRTAQRSSELI